MLTCNGYGRTRLLEERLSMARRGLKNLYKATIFEFCGTVMSLEQIHNSTNVDDSECIDLLRIGSPNVQKTEISQFESMFRADPSLSMNQDIWTTIRKLKSHGFRVVFLIRSGYYRPSVIKETQNLESVESTEKCQIAPRKLQNEIYEEILGKLGLLAAECIYVGDMISQVRGVERFGITGVQIMNQDSASAIQTLEHLLKVDLH
ncbi:hypothetical protein M3Y94_01116200 [Aphelenchoides besseyi]|nr:hypothetical protein M3Y94_01116200 [Aphelenchoides besseyi]